MSKLAQADWDALTEEEQALRIDEKPDEITKPDETLETLGVQVKDLTAKLDEATKEKNNFYGVMKGGQEMVQALEAELKEIKAKLDAKGDDDLLRGKADDEYLTVGEARKILEKAETKAKSAQAGDDVAAQKELATENYASSEEAMLEKDKANKLPIPYKEALAEFNAMASKNKALWVSVHQESIRRGGKPSELAYKIALTSDKFIDKIKAGAREKLLNDLEKEGKIKPRKIASGGPGKGPLNPANLSEEDLLNMSETDLDELLAKT